MIQNGQNETIVYTAKTTDIISLLMDIRNFFNQDLSSWDVSNVNSYSGFSGWTPQWTLPKPNFN